MNIATDLIKKYPFIPSTFEIYTENIFYHLKKLDIIGYTMYVCDESVQSIAKHYINNLNHFCVLPHKRALPTIANANYIENECKKHNIRQIIAFGTGAINDLCKYVSHKISIKFIFIPTAISMNGVVSNNTSLYSDDFGVKQSFIVKAASVILLDETILTSAPRKFIGSAIMDSLAGYTACNDFIYANKINAKEYSFEAFTFNIFHKQMQKILQIVEKNTEDLYINYDTILNVFELMYISGMTMNYYNSSIAFSGGEHNIAHTLESQNPYLKTEFLHGEIISAILPFYANLQLEYDKNDYIEFETVQKNLGSINFKKIAEKLEMQTSFFDLGINEDDFVKCVKNAKYAKNRPTLLSVLF